MHIRLRSSQLVWLVLSIVLVADQVLKIWVKTHLEYGEEFSLLGLPWAFIHFVENNGMAFGLSMGGDYGKLLLSLFRLIAVGFLFVFIRRLIQENASAGVIVGFALILAGALGNILDSAFYGIIFSESPYYGGHAVLFPESGGYASFLHGKVVDMLYFPIAQGTWPEWVPWLGGQYFQFFKPVFNIADMAITSGVLNVLIFQRHFFKKHAESTAQLIQEETTPPDADLPPGDDLPSEKVLS